MFEKKFYIQIHLARAQHITPNIFYKKGATSYKLRAARRRAAQIFLHKIWSYNRSYKISYVLRPKILADFS